MASFETITAVQPLTAVKGLRGSSLSGSKLFIKPSRKSFKSKSTRAGALVAKYGDISVIFAASQVFYSWRRLFAYLCQCFSLS
ncbi:hypothetical protein Bca4012_098789 [Brassica carinata]|uniref:Photosystem I reaction center subunit VI n=1 Tax=Brassica cretica TaxID=69181 RepID=A0A8S9PQC6_BRACR|nr:hypothetical protein F2Q69_00047329 [Brassica cretica]